MIRKTALESHGFALLKLASVVAVVGLCAFPLYWMALTAVKPGTEIFSSPPLFFTTDPTLAAFRRLLSMTRFTTYLTNSVVTAGGATVLSLAVSTLAAYGVTRFRFRGREAFAQAVLYAYTFAPIVIVVPLYGIFRDVGLVNSRLGLVLAYASFGVPFSLWLLRSFFASIPLDLEEAALIDGANRPRAVWHVILPLALPGVIAVSVFTFLLAWNDYLFARVLITDDALKTLPVGLHDLLSASLLDWPMIMAGAVLTNLPVLIGFFFAQRYLIAGWGSGGVKG